MSFPKYYNCTTDLSKTSIARFHDVGLAHWVIALVISGECLVGMLLSCRTKISLSYLELGRVLTCMLCLLLIDEVQLFAQKKTD